LDERRKWMRGFCLSACKMRVLSESWVSSVCEGEPDGQQTFTPLAFRLPSLQLEVMEVIHVMVVSRSTIWYARSIVLLSRLVADLHQIDQNAINFMTEHRSQYQDCR
jgi:hypothetical protein